MFRHHQAWGKSSRMRMRITIHSTTTLSGTFHQHHLRSQKITQAALSILNQVRLPYPRSGDFQCEVEELKRVMEFAKPYMTWQKWGPDPNYNRYYFYNKHEAFLLGRTSAA